MDVCQAVHKVDLFEVGGGGSGLNRAQESRLTRHGCPLSARQSTRLILRWGGSGFRAQVCLGMDVHQAVHTVDPKVGGVRVQGQAFSPGFRVWPSVQGSGSGIQSRVQGQELKT